MREFKRGFSLVEIAVTMIVVAILSGITLNIFSFQKNFWLLRQTAFNLARNLSQAKNFSFQGLSFENKKICGAGLLFTASQNYLGVAINSTEKDCSSLTSNLFNLTEVSDPENNSSVIKISKFSNFTMSSDGALKEELNNIVTTIAIDLNSNKIDFQKFEIMFKNPYGDPIVFYEASAGGITEITNWNAIKIQFSLKSNNNETSEVTITKTGQILFE